MVAIEDAKIVPGRKSGVYISSVFPVKRVMVGLFTYSTTSPTGTVHHLLYNITSLNGHT